VQNKYYKITSLIIKAILITAVLLDGINTVENTLHMNFSLHLRVENISP